MPNFIKVKEIEQKDSKGTIFVVRVITSVSEGRGFKAHFEEIDVIAMA